MFAHYDLTDRASYRAMLEAHAEVLLRLEAQLDHCAELVIDDWSERKRTALLNEDRHDLGMVRLPIQGKAVIGHVTSTGVSTAPLESGRIRQLLNNEEPARQKAAIAGTLYVLEGSRLGGRFLARRLPPDFPRRYLDADQPADKWRKFLEKFDALLYQQALLDSAAEAAVEAFAAFERSGRKWLMKAK
ncbi:biliverdin-producing heme oxygenase [Stakelama tenebrarum]|uniref:Biliverdin-producing heme oxygenase n=1 Tax=Stakelama tenebrarum TaxID=2711215 RepID=A0A6G6Y343_9SPHN|nr:biliverdin-producing heme oxygenase [Sphingosinithalassobacter tenebrarum]QIG79227.1 biliverdin-producing heme oxygenase [Sphingosinithalassobacter tenebrarum]